MFHLPSAFRRHVSHSRLNHRSTSPNPLDYGQLEPREMLAFNGVVSGTTLTLTQTIDDGPITIDNNGAGNAFRTIDGAGTQAWPSATNVVIKLMPLSGNPLALDLDNPHSGDLRIKLGDGIRHVTFTGNSNTVQGLMRIDGGTDNQMVDLVANQDLTVGGDLVIALGDDSGDQVVQTNKAISVQGSWRLFGVNQFYSQAAVSVQGNLRIATASGLESMDFQSLQSLSVTGDLQFVGANGRDQLSFSGLFSRQILGNALVDLGGAGFVNNTQIAFFESTTFGGDLMILAGNSQGVDELTLASTVSIAGNVDIDVGPGENTLNAFASLSGGDLEYRGGTDVDQAHLGLTGNVGLVNVILGTGDDTAKLYSGMASPNLLRVDFGTGTGDTIVNEYGKFKFDATLLNLHGANAYYSKALDQWDVRQIQDLGAFKLGTTVLGDVFFKQGTIPADLLGDAENLRLTMLSNSGNVDISLETPLAGVLIANVKHGNRIITVSAPQIAYVDQLIRIDGAQGDQQVTLQNVSTSNLTVNLRQGVDAVTISDTSNFFGNSILRGVNSISLPASSELTVQNNLVVNSRFFTEGVSLTSHGNLKVFGKLIYLGGDGSDSMSFVNSQIGDAYIDIGSSVSGSQNIILSDTTIGLFPGTPGSLIVLGGPAINNYLFLGSQSVVRGFVSVDFSANNIGQNKAIFSGTLLGNRVRYQGGTQDDDVKFELLNARTVRAELWLGDGQDQLNLVATTQLDSLFADFGADVDTFLDGFGGVAPFPVETLNLP